MSKINLLEAKARLDKILVVDAFASYLRKTQAEDVKNLAEIKSLATKIRNAEKHFKIDDIMHQIDMLILNRRYYDPGNSMFYYKDNIPDNVEKRISDFHDDITHDIEQLKNKIEQLSEHIFIEV